ncbi:MAG: hypothetical protein JXB15_12810 [Anaerolineales bacterium]|nr:hypothetical protein [Anaerolineales bacterium]
MVKFACMLTLQKLFQFLRYTLPGVLRTMLGFLVGMLLLSTSSLTPADRTEQVRAFTRQIEFDYVAWTVNALQVKLFEFATGASAYLETERRGELVREYMKLVAQIQRYEYELDLIYADPAVQDPQTASQALRKELDALYAQRNLVGPVAEAILQEQVSLAIAQAGLSLGGQPLPPVMYHSTPLPLALIVSPRQVIRQDENISLVPDFPVDRQAELEAQVDQALDVSSLVVEIGGVGVYPTMVQQTSALDWLSEVVAHEWIHNYLTLRPLGANYMTSPELRIMNETTASIAGKELGRLVLEIYYPELLPPPEPPPGEQPAPEPPAFDYRLEMNVTRRTVDALLAEGKIEEAEKYMEERRVIFWQNGYRHLRKINQAYFAFYGAYADEPGGAAGVTEDPIGAAVRALRQASPSLAAFINRMSWMTSYEQLLQAVQVPAP